MKLTTSTQLADEHRRERHEGDDLADRRQALRMQPDADEKNREQRQGRGRPRATTATAHQERPAIAR